MSVKISTYRQIKSPVTFESAAGLQPAGWLRRLADPSFSRVARDLATLANHNAIIVKPGDKSSADRLRCYYFQSNVETTFVDGKIGLPGSARVNAVLRRTMVERIVIPKGSTADWIKVEFIGNLYRHRAVSRPQQPVHDPDDVTPTLV
ncbi:MAG: hypothetical protein JW873_01705 [Candidatus Saganbacteria bacterium]|nr:hypothetical protein [Candidatus Saganbacteria bacterium]